MYLPEHFEVTNRDEIFEFVDINTFVNLFHLLRADPFLPICLFLSTKTDKDY